MGRNLVGLVLLSCWLPQLGVAQPGPGPVGDGLRGAYYQGLNFEHFVRARRDPRLDFNWRERSPIQGVSAEHFTVRWTGWLLAPVTGRYVLQAVVDDGVRLWLDDQPLLDEWGGQPLGHYRAAVELQAGRAYRLRLDYAQYSATSRLQLSWERPRNPEAISSWRNLWSLATAPQAGNHYREVVPTRYLFTHFPAASRAETPAWPVVATPVVKREGQSARSARPVVARPAVPRGLAPSSAGALPLGDGLTAVYHEGMAFQKVAARRIDRTIDFDWSFRAPQHGYPFSQFSVRWTGFVYAPLTGRYTFRTISDDGIRVWIDGHLLVDEWRPQPPLVATSQVTLQAGQYYAVRVEYFQAERTGRVFLGWDLPGDSPAFSGEDIGGAGQTTTARVPRPIDPGYFFTRRPAPPAPAPPPAKPVTTPVSPKSTVPQPVRARLRAKPNPPAPPVAPRVAPIADWNTLATGTALPLERLYFVQSTARLRVDSRPELERLVTRVREAPTIRLEIAGHTDNVGDSTKNRHLSQQRAAVVRAYLVEHGIDSARVTARGYGGTRPVADNRDPVQRPRNRRVEVIIR